MEPLQYILTLISDMLSADGKGSIYYLHEFVFSSRTLDSRAKLFHGLVSKGVEPYLPFVRLLNLSNWYILKNALDIVCLLLRYA